MKLIQIVLAAIAAMFLSSCQGTHQIPVPGGTVMIGDPGGGQQRGYPQQYAEGGHSGPPGARREGQPPQDRPWGQKVVTRQKWLTQETQGVHITVEGAASSAVCLQVRETVGSWCKATYAEHGVFPTKNEAENKAAQEFATLGYNLQASSERGPGVFIITEYQTSDVVKGEPKKEGEPEIVEKRDVMREEVPQSILERSRKGKIEPHVGQTTEGTVRLGETIHPNM